MGQHRQVQMGVAGGVAVAGKVLGASEHRLLEPPLGATARALAVLESSPQARTLILVGVVVDVAHRPQHPVQPTAAGLFAGAAAIALTRSGNSGSRWWSRPRAKGGTSQPAPSKRWPTPSSTSAQTSNRCSLQPCSCLRC